MSERILIIDHIEDIIKDGEMAGKECFDKTGESVKVKKGKGGSLEKRWDELLIGRAYSFDMGEFKGYPFVADFKSVESKFVEQAQERVEDKTIDTKNKSVTISYAKDLAIADKIETAQICAYAEVFYRYITGALTVEDTTIINLMRGGKDETNTSKQIKSSQAGTSERDRQDSREKTGKLRADDTGGDETTRERIKELYEQRGWWSLTKEWTSPKVIEHLRGITGKPDIKQLSEAELTNVESDLQTQVELMKGG